jgi:DNA topoisomerase-2
MSKASEIKVSEFLKNEYKDFSFYVLESRAIPSLVDGFKPTQRKIMFVADRHVRSGKNKVATLAGKVISDAQYHHGNVSCEDAIVNLAQEFKNNIPLLERSGQFGSLKSPKAAASRYIEVKMSKEFDKIYKDKELLRHKTLEGQKIEPEYYLPIIPMVLVNASMGIAVGFATNTLMRDAKDVTKKCIDYLEGKPVRKLNPNINTFVGDFVNDKENHKKWYIKGRIEKKHTTLAVVTELPPSMTFEKFEKHLDDLNDKRIISDWENHGGKGKIEYHVKFTREELLKYDDSKLLDLFKLVDQTTENYTLLDEKGKLKIFEKTEDILKYFVDFRLTYYQKRKDYLLQKIKEDIEKMSNRAKFIKAIIDGKIVINKKTKNQIIKQIENEKIEQINDSYDYLLSMPIYSLSKEKYDELLQGIKDKKEEEKGIKKMVPKQVYIDELKELYKLL